MRGGWLGGTAAVLVLLFVFVGYAEESLFVNGDAVQLPGPILWGTEETSVPLEPFAKLVGVEADVERGVVDLRWSGGRETIPLSSFLVLDDALYISVEWLVERMGGEIHRIGDAMYVETPFAMLSEVSATGAAVSIRFDRFSPETVERDGERWIVRFHHCRTTLAPRTILAGDGPVSEVRVLPRAGSLCDVSLTLQDQAALSIQRFEAAGFYSVTLSAGADTSRETITEVGEDLSVHEMDLTLDRGNVEIDYVHVEDWRTRFEIRPMLPSGGVGTSASVLAIAREHRAVVALPGRSAEALGLVLVDRVPMSLPADPAIGVGFDAFDRWTRLDAGAAPYLDAGTRRISVDGVNRPVGGDELIVFPPGYAGEIGWGVLGPLRVIKVREERVVSIFDGMFVVPDRTATMLVAAGGARERLAPLELGDRVRLRCAFGDDRTLVDAAVSVSAFLVQDAGTSVWEGTTNTTASLGLREGSSGWSVLAADWYGGLVFLSVSFDGLSVGLDPSELASFLGRLPIPLRDAVVLEQGGDGTLVYSDGRVTHQLGEGQSVGVALGLVRVAP